MWRILESIIVVMLAAMIVMVFSNVVLRYGFASGLRASEELSRMMFVWVVMLGAALTLRRGEHMAVTELSDMLIPRRPLALIRFGLWLAVIVMMGAFVWGCVIQTRSNWQNISQLTGLPLGLFYLSGIVSGGAMLVLILGEIKHQFAVFTGRADTDQPLGDAK